MKKYYKCYSNCCIAPIAIKEIDEEDAKRYIIETVNQYIDDHGFDDLEPFNGIDWDDCDDDALSSVWEKVYDKAIEYFEENEYYECDDFIILYTDEYPSRGDSYNNSTFMLYL